jgi:Uma2 family endonuclease
MSAQAIPHYTVAEYLAIDDEADRKSEYYQGCILAMAGGTPAHGLITMNTALHLNAGLRKKNCRLINDVRLAIDRASHYTYPDMMVVCGEVKVARGQKNTVTNPVLIVEVLSPSTEREDRGRKFAGYRTIAGFREYVLIAQDEPRVEVYQRTEDGAWILHEYLGLEAVAELESVECSLPLAGIYEKAGFSVVETDEPGARA